MSLDTLLEEMTATLQQKNQTGGSSGGVVNAWSDLATGVPIRKQDAKGEVKRRYESRGLTVTHTIFTQEGRGRSMDRWVVDGAYYLIRGWRKREGIGGMETFYVYDAEEFLI